MHCVGHTWILCCYLVIPPEGWQWSIIDCSSTVRVTEKQDSYRDSIVRTKGHMAPRVVLSWAKAEMPTVPDLWPTGCACDNNAVKIYLIVVR